jgi:2-methylcitrate dehydratase PrpD
VQDPTIAALAERVRPIVTPGIAPEQVELTITLRDGRKFERRIERAIGSVENPMSDAALEQKFRDLAVDILPADRVSELIGLCRDVETLASAAEIATRAAQIIGSPA